MNKFANFIIKNHKRIILVSIVLTVVMSFFITKLIIKPGMIDLLPANNSYVKVYNKASKTFNGIDSIIVGINGNEKDIINYINNVSEKIKTLEDTDNVISKMPLEFISKNLILFSNDLEQEYLKQILTSDSLVSFFHALNKSFEEPKKGYKIDNQSKKQFKSIIKNLTVLLNSINENKNIEKNTKNFLLGSEYMISNDGKMGIFIINPSIDSNDIFKIVNFVNTVEKIIKENALKYNVKADITGTYVISRDEMETSDRDMAVSTIVSLILILIIFILGFKIFRYTILSVVPLLIGILWSLGLTYFLIGSLNIMTMMMASILMGLGIDYSIHIISIFLEYRNEGYNIEDSIRQIYLKSVRGIISGSVTTAIGFGLFAFSSFPAFKEFGIVLSLGIISILIASILILPSLLMIYGNKFKQSKSYNININIKKIRLPALIITIVLLVLSFYKIGNVSFETNMMKIEAKGLKSLELNQKLIEKFELSSDNTIFINDSLEDARRLKKQLTKLETVSMIDSIVDYIPEKTLQNSRLNYSKAIKNYNSQIEKIDISKLRKELSLLNVNLLKSSLALRALKENKLADSLLNLMKSNIVNKISKQSSLTLLNAEKKINSVLFNIKNNLNTKNFITINSIPENIKENYYNNGLYLTTVYPSGDIWKYDFQKKYFNDLNKIKDKEVSGTGLIFLKVIELSGKEGGKILIATIIAIYFVLLLDLRNFKYSIIATLPMILSVIILLGIMGWFNIKFNVVNIIAFPLIIGIGVDDGIHLIHRYKIEKSLSKALKSTGKAITLTTLTTVAAFGSFMLAKYRGFVGLGLIFTIGITLSYLITIFTVTSIISYIDKVGE
ncbi:RND transporter [Tepiditoga spiralis]|uniref:RND transporter n=1 Tax=Tepiditoga spiralis TaxID=2108365 RepID=A0A7G1G5W8_9BACT|nr:MMPL family transporter [Tepiditoga spiralis]BBE31545.1 RND transporter [Tepiditoga spiralis]